MVIDKDTPTITVINNLLIQVILHIRIIRNLQANNQLTKIIILNLKI